MSEINTDDFSEEDINNVEKPTYEELRSLLEVLTREMMRTDATLERLRELRKITPQDMQQEYT